MPLHRQAWGRSSLERRTAVRAPAGPSQGRTAPRGEARGASFGGMFLRRSPPPPGGGARRRASGKPTGARPLTLAALLSQLVQVALALALAPLLVGWVNQCRAWLANRSAPPLLLPYRTIRKLFMKDAVVASNASPIFRLTPYVVFGAMCCAAAIVPSLATDLPFAAAADAIALVGLFALARVFIALAAMDIGTAFGSLGARREMFVGFLAEPALLMVLFTASLISGSTSLPSIVDTLAHRELAIYPSLAFAGVAFTMVSLAENARIPVDNPGIHDCPRF